MTPSVRLPGGRRRAAREGGRPGFLDRAAANAVLGALDRLPRGRLRFTLPDGSRRVVGGGAPGPETVVRVRRWAFFRKILLGGGTEAGGAYIDGDWEADDLVAVIGYVIANDARLEEAVPFARIGVALERARHALRRNTLRGARRNVVDHYDLSNDLYALFLDETMTYSCGLFERPEDSLADAQRNKIRRLAAKARLAPGHRVLEIGCGWGGFLAYAAGELGCRARGITLSEAQAGFARRRLAEVGLEDAVSVDLVDYRRVEGAYDRIVSIEMLEGVGEAYLGEFFEAIDRLLAPGGVAAVQVITIPDERYPAYRRGMDYTRKYVFPGSHLPSLGALVDAIRDTRLQIVDLENIGTHYAETLRRWRLRFLDAVEDVRALGFDDSFVRRWEFYLAFCEAAFAARHLNDLQLVLARAGNVAAFGAGPYRSPG